DLRTVTNIQTQQHLSLIHRQLNYSNSSISTLKICIQQIQTATFSNKSILTNNIYVLPQKESKSLLANILRSIQQTDIVFLNNNNNWPKPADHKGIMIDMVIQFLDKLHLV